MPGRNAPRLTFIPPEYDVNEVTDLLAQPHCPAATLLPPRLQADVLRAHPTVDLRLLGVYLTCAFDPHDEGDHHAVLYDHFPSPDAGALWTTWSTGRLPSTFTLHPDCPATSPGGTACAHFLRHPGPHSWEPRELQGQALDEYLGDYESRKGRVSDQARQRARQVFDEVHAEEAERPATG